MRVNSIFLLILISHFLYILYGLYIYDRFSTLGDTFRYLNQDIFFSWEVLFFSTRFTEFFGSIVGLLPHVIEQFPTLILSTTSVFYLFKTLKDLNFIRNDNDIVIFLFVIMSPTFAMYSSVYGKEAFIAASSCILISSIVKYSAKAKLNVFLLILAIFIMAIVKVQYLIPFILLAIVVYIFKISKNNSTAILFLFLLSLTGISIFIYIYDFIDSTSLTLHNHFDTQTSRVTRDNPFKDSGDFISYMPIGLPLSFIGLTITEIINDPFKTIFFRFS